MKKISIAIFSFAPLTIEGVKSILSSNKVNIYEDFENYEHIFTNIANNPPDIFFIDDFSVVIEDLTDYIKRIIKISNKTKVLLYTDKTDAIYLRYMINIGVKALIHKKSSKDKLLEALESFNLNSVYIDSLINCIVSRFRIDNNIKYYELSKREKEILNLIALGMKNQHIADTLCISQHTVESHKAHLLKKLNLKSTAELVVYAASGKII